jgi:SH3 domain-containing YSC84-like protein 1
MSALLCGEHQIMKLAMILGFAIVLFAQEDTPDKRLRAAADSFQQVMQTPDKGIPRDLLERAECVVIIPGMKKAAFVVGGQYGRGFASCRNTSGGWSGPAALRLAGGSFGLQLGGNSTDLFLLVMNQQGLNHLLSDKFTIGADAAAAAGPVGRNATADTDVLLHAEILSWSRSRGAFAGVSLNGTTVETDKGEDQKLYGKAMDNKDIIQGQVPPPAASQQLIAELDQYARRKGSADRSRQR